VWGQNCDWFLSAKLEELLGLMIEVLPSCHFSAKRHRLDCLYFLVVHVAKVVEDRSAIFIIIYYYCIIIILP
jgi:ribosomal RNA-processing protein 12